MKAANTNGLVPVIADLVRDHFNDADERTQTLRPTVMRLCENLRAFYDLVYAAPMIVPMRDVEVLRTICIDNGESWLMLREAGRAANEHIYKVTPKVHNMLHTGIYAETPKPRFVQFYATGS